MKSVYRWACLYPGGWQGLQARRNRTSTTGLGAANGRPFLTDITQTPSAQHTMPMFHAPTEARQPVPSGPAWRCARTVCAASLAALVLMGSAHADALAEARALAAQGDTPAALRRVDTAIAADSRDVQLRFLRGVLLLDLQRDAEALTHFEKMCLEFPELPDPYNNVALLLARAQRLDEARVALETALRNDPGHRTARANLSQVYLALAARTLESLAQQGPLEAAQQRRLQAVRALLQDAAPR